MAAASRRLIWPFALAALAATLYLGIRIKRDTLVDFEVYRTASVRALAAEPLYRPEDGHYQFKYLPAFALAMAPFGLLPRETATGLWYVLSVTLLCLFVNTSVAALPDRRVASRTLLWIVAVLTGKFWIKELMLGQSNALLGVVLILAFVAAQSGLWRRAGVLVGVGVFIKPYAIVLVPWLLLAGGPTPAAFAAAVIGAGLVAPAAVYGRQGNGVELSEWYRTVTGTTGANLIFPENVSFSAMTSRWLGPGPDASHLALLLIAAAGALVATAMALRRGVASPAYLEFALILLFVPLISPQGWDYVLLLATPALVILIDRWRSVNRVWQAATAVGIACVCLTIFDLLGRALYARLMSWSLVTLGAVVLAVALVHLRVRRQA